MDSSPKNGAKSLEGQKQHTSCFVHSLLEKQRKAKAQGIIPLPHSNDNTPTDKALTPVPHQDGARHSRLLTKKQLSEMAWGVRELSKKLGSVRLRLKVKTVFILTKAHDETLIDKSRDVVDWLLSSERDAPYVV